MPELKYALAALVLGSVGLADCRASAADEFGARIRPDEPRLSVSTQPQLCEKVLDTAKEAYASSAADMDIGLALHSRFAPVAWTVDPLSREPLPGATFNRVQLDLDGTGHPQVLVTRSIEQSWRGNWTYAYVFPSVAAFDAVKASLGKSWSALPDAQYPDPAQLDRGARQYFPSAMTTQGPQLKTGDVWAEHALFESSGRYYFLTGWTAYDRQDSPSYSLFQVHASGLVDVTCTVEFPNTLALRGKIEQLPAFATFLHLIRGIGTGGEDSGTLHSAAAHDAGAEAAVLRAASRPWATSLAGGEGNYHRYDARTIQFLEWWGGRDRWSLREYQTLQEAMEPAENALAAYLRSEFGLEQAAALTQSRRVVEELIGARLLIPKDFGPGDSEGFYILTPLEAAIARLDRASFDAALRQLRGPDAKADANGVSPEQQLATALQNAVEWPYALSALLEAGIDPNSANDNGKTALMTAAHLNRPDAIRTLLKAGAKVNATTQSGPSGFATPLRTRRTALMYAAENAGPAAIKLLLDAGADVMGRDSAGNGIDFYLKLNPRFTPTENAAGIQGVAALVSAHAGPGFDCAAAQSGTEKTICRSDVLRQLDFEVASAYQTLLAKAGATVKNEQRQWLRRRDSACPADNAAECLAVLLRTRVRYLHMRSSELELP